MTTATLMQTTIKVCNVDVDGDYDITIEDGGDEASLTLTCSVPTQTC